MTITQSDTSKVITVANPISNGFAYLHTVVKVDFSTASLVDSNIINSTSTFTLNADSLYYIVSIKLPTITPTESGVFYIHNNVILQYNDSTEYTAVDLLNMDFSQTSFANDVEERFIIHKYNIVRNYNTIKKTIAKNISGCSIDKSLSLINNTLMMGIYVIDTLVLNSQ
jgi:predicted metal-dependent hydrolase